MDDKQRTHLRHTFATRLAEKHMRLTPERLHILETAIGIKGTFTASKLESLIMEGPLRMSRATLFNTLPLIADAGVIRRVSTGGYEVVTTAVMEPRLLLVCTECGRVHRRKLPELKAWVESQSYRDFAPSEGHMELVVHGVCGRCRRAQRIRKTKKQKV